MVQNITMAGAYSSTFPIFRICHIWDSYTSSTRHNYPIPYVVPQVLNHTYAIEGGQKSILQPAATIFDYVPHHDS